VIVLVGIRRVRSTQVLYVSVSGVLQGSGFQSLRAGTGKGRIR
jgi:hypothetical protein